MRTLAHKKVRLLVALILALTLHFLLLFSWHQRIHRNYHSSPPSRKSSKIEVALAFFNEEANVSSEANPEPNLTTAVSPLPTVSSSDHLTPRPPSQRAEKRAVARNGKSAYSQYKRNGFSAGKAETAQAGYLYNPRPAYPLSSRKSGHQGVVLLRVRIDQQGNVSTASVIKSSGYMELDQQALSTVRRHWKFNPAQKGSIPVATEVAIPIHFSLHNFSKSLSY